MTHLDSILKNRHHFASLYSQSYGFSNNHVWMWELDHKEGWVLKNWCFQIVVLEKTLESLLDYQEIKLINPKWYKLWIFIGKNDAEAEMTILWPPDVKSWKDPDARKDWKEEEGSTEDEMVEWHYWPVNMSLSELRDIVNNRGAWHAAVHGVTKGQTQLSDWTQQQIGIWYILFSIVDIVNKH